MNYKKAKSYKCDNNFICKSMENKELVWFFALTGGALYTERSVFDWLARSYLAGSTGLQCRPHCRPVSRFATKRPYIFA